MKLAATLLAGSVAALKTRDGDCNEWFYQESCKLWYREPCEDEYTESDCGRIYWSDWHWIEYWVDCDDVESWD